MDDLKYRYNQPKGQEELLEAIYEELSVSPDRRRNPFFASTLKDYLASLVEHTKELERERQFGKEFASQAITHAMGLLAVISFLLLIVGIQRDGDWEWLNHNRFTMWLWGLGFGAVFIGISIERSSFFQHIWSFWFTKVVASLALSGLIIFSTGKASSLINGVFSVDAAAFPLTRTVVTGLLAFQYAYPLLITLIVIFTLLHGLDAFGWIKARLSTSGSYRLPPLHSMGFLVISLILLPFFSRLTSYDFSNDVWPMKVYRLAHTLDFNQKYECGNLRKGLWVVFLGPDQSRVLVDMSNVETNDMKSFLYGSRENDITVPERFYVLSCDFSVLKAGN